MKSPLKNTELVKKRKARGMKNWKKDNINANKNLLSTNIIYTKGKKYIHLTEGLNAYYVRYSTGNKKFKKEEDAVKFINTYMREH